MQNKGLIISAKRTGKEWTATASFNGEYAGSCTAKSKEYAEKEARKAGESYSRNLSTQRKPAVAPAQVPFIGKMLGGFIGPLANLNLSNIKAPATAAG